MRALLVDFGGVLTTNVFESFRAFEREAGLVEDAVVHLFLEDEPALADLHALETGRLAEAEFERRLAARLGVEAEQLVAGLFAGARPEPAMLHLVRRARVAGVATALVSNSWGTGIYERLGGGSDFFDAIVLSGEVGRRKPDPEIFLLAAERVGAPPASCVFVDDLRSNCAGAEAVGMTAVLHRAPAPTIERVEDLLGLGSLEQE